MDNEIKIVEKRDNAPKTGFAGLVQALQREDDYISLVRVFAAIAFILFFTMYVIAFVKAGYVFQHFDTFSTVVCTIIFSTLGGKGLDIWREIKLGK